MAWEQLPLFRFGSRTPPGQGLPLGLISGPLLIDSGEAENTFLFECQDRFLVYNSLAGLRTVLFVSDQNHKDRYIQLTETLNRRLEIIGRLTGLHYGSVPTPFFVPIDVRTLRLTEDPLFSDGLQDPGIQASLKQGLLLCNQVSPTAATLISGISAKLNEAGWSVGWDLPRISDLGRLALRFHDKSHYVNLLADRIPGLPPHVPTALLSVKEVLEVRSWHELSRLFQTRTQSPPPSSLFLKSNLDSAGNCSARLTTSTFEKNIQPLTSELKARWTPDAIDPHQDATALRAILSESTSLDGIEWTDRVLAELKRMQRERRPDPSMLLQPAIEFPKGHPDSFGALGVGCHIEENGEIQVHSVAGQLFEDSDMKRYRGSFLAHGADQDLSPSEVAEAKRLAGLFAEEGYSGPLGFDACRNDAHELQYVFDCNPRLTAVYTTLVLEQFLITSGFPPRSVASLGYRGSFVISDIENTLMQLDRRSLLFTHQRPRGILLLPNLGGRDGHDLLFVDLTVAEIQKLLDSDFFRELVNSPTAGNSLFS